MKYLFFFLLFFSMPNFGQKNEAITHLPTKESHKFLELLQEEKQYYIGNHVEYYIDSTRLLSFEEVQKKKFYKLPEPPSESQSIVWYKFYTIPKTASKLLLFSPNIVDLSDIYIPYKKGYKHFEVGILTNRKINHYVDDGTVLNLPIDTLDFTKPFYYNKRQFGFLGKKYSKYSGFLFTTNNTNNWNSSKLKEYIEINNFKLCVVVVFISFLLFLVSFFITKDKNFLYYSLYLLFTTTIFLYLFPEIYNFIIAIHPFIFKYIGPVSIILASVSYFYFVIYFVELKNKNLKIYKLAKYTVLISLLFVVFVVLQQFFVPYFKYRYQILDFYNIAFLIISSIIFLYLVFTPLSKAKRIVVIGSLFLLVGQMISVVWELTFFFIGGVIIEIIIFSGVVSYQNRVNNNKKILSESALELEKNKRENLEELDKAKSNFFTNVSHEFRTPLTMISGPLQSLLQNKNLKVEEKLTFEMMHRNSKRLLSLVDQILSISKVKTGDLQLKISENNLITFIGVLANGFTFKAKEKEINYFVYPKNNRDKAYYDPDIVEKIIVNLLSNAIKYTPQNGTIICSFKIVKDKLHFTIKNTGKGLSKTELANIFERFYQVHENSEGIGIGLALVKELIKLNRGTITVESTQNEWTTFKLTLPITKESFTKNELVTNSSHVEESLQNLTANNTIITVENKLDENEENPILLIVDDNNDIRSYVTSLFKDSYCILSAKNGQDGIDLAVKHIPDIIISDIMMPIKNGIELCNTLKVDERTSHIPIILLTAKAGEENEIEGIKASADNYVTKPFNENLLKIRVEKLLENRKKLQLRYSQEVILRPKEIAISSFDEQFLERVQHVLEDKLIESSFSIQDFSDAVGMSRMQLHRKLKALTGLSASAFIRSQRLKLAAQLLENSEINVSQISYSVGFNDHAYFSKCFKEVYHCTPSEYIKRH